MNLTYRGVSYEMTLEDSDVFGGLLARVEPWPAASSCSIHVPEGTAAAAIRRVKRSIDREIKALAARRVCELIVALGNESLPRELRAGDYTATREYVSQGWVPQWSARWIVSRDSVEVGRIFDGHTYLRHGFGKPHYAMTQLVWSGPFPEGYPKNPDGRLVFDGGPFESYQETIDKFAIQADALIAWRARHALLGKVVKAEKKAKARRG